MPIQTEDSAAVFEAIVEADMRGDGTVEHAQYLRDPENNRRWRDVLVTFLGNMASQLSQRKADFKVFEVECLKKGPAGRQEFFAGKAEYEKWKAKAVFRRQAIERVLRDVKRRSREIYATEDNVRSKDRWFLLNWAADLIPMKGLGVDWHRAFGKLKKRDTIGEDTPSGGAQIASKVS